MASSLPARFINSLSVHVSSRDNETDCWHSTEAEVFDADGDLDMRQSRLTRRFVHARLEEAFVRRTFPLGRAWVRVMLCFTMVYELGLIVHALACQCGIRWQLAGHWYLRLLTMGAPFPLTALLLAFTYSHRCTPHTLQYATAFGTLVLVLIILVPNSLAAGELAQEIVVGADGAVHTQIGALEDFRNLLMQHTVVEFFVALVGTLIFDAAGLSPPAMILLNVACVTLHVSLSDSVFSARFGPELSVARAWWHPALSVIGMQIVQAYVVSALKRRVFLVQFLTAAHRIEQLSREKERVEWQQLLLTAQAARRTPPAQAAHEIDVGIDDPKSLAAAVESVTNRAAALPRLLPSSGLSDETDGEIVSQLGKPMAGAESPSASTAPAQSPGLVSLRHELQVSRRALQAQREAAASHAWAPRNRAAPATVSCSGGVSDRVSTESAQPDPWPDHDQSSVASSAAAELAGQIRIDIDIEADDDKISTAAGGFAATRTANVLPRRPHAPIQRPAGAGAADAVAAASGSESSRTTCTSEAWQRAAVAGSEDGAPLSSAGVDSVATSDTAAELQAALDCAVGTVGVRRVAAKRDRLWHDLWQGTRSREGAHPAAQRPPVVLRAIAHRPRTLAEMSRMRTPTDAPDEQQKQQPHPLLDFVLALRGQRRPGAMPGQMPVVREA